MKRVLVTGGAGFIGSALVRRLVLREGWDVLTVDKLTYAGTLTSLAAVEGRNSHRFAQADICDGPAMRRLIEEFRPDAILHLAAESHVDRSISEPGAFVQTNVVGTATLLTVVTAYWQGLDAAAKAGFRFLHVSTDEVFGALGDDGFFTEDSPYRPNSPYAASKAGSDHLVRAWQTTYGLPVLITNCSNNYGPHQLPEKLIPLMIVSARAGAALPVYGQGRNVRDWLYVDDHADALKTVVERGRVGETYAISGRAERRNIDVVRGICAVLDEALPDSPHRPHADLISYVTDRPGHDFRYAIDDRKLRDELGWSPRENFESGLAKTVRWYLDNEAWWRPLLERSALAERFKLSAAE